MARARYKILVVDDFPDVAEITCALLRLLGHDCKCVEDGRSAIAAAAVFLPDIVLCDIGLPDLSGYEIARALRAAQGNRPLHLCAITGWGTVADRNEALAAGFDQHVLKPTDADVLRGVLAATAVHLSGARVEATA